MNMKSMSKKEMIAGYAVMVLVVVGVVAFAPSAHATDDLEGWHTWATTNESEPTSSTVHWPQSYVGKGQLAPDCGVWYQQDKYEEPKHGASIADVIADGVLTNGEDHHIVQEWRFEYGGDCTEPEVTEGEAVTVVAGCEGDEWVTRTTTTEWTQTGDQPRVYGESVTTETREYDPTCDPDTPACGPIGSCGEVPDSSEPETPPTPKPEPTPAPEEPSVGAEAKPATPVAADATYTG